jgi:hypothetical protein
MDDPQFQIARLELKPGDILVLKAPGFLPATAQARIKSDLERICPGVKCMVLEGGMELAVLTREEIEQRSAPSLPAKELDHA